MNIPFTNSSLGFYNILSCKGFEESEKIGMTFGPCAQAKVILVVLFFINALVRKWIGETFDIEYSFWGGMIGSMVGAFVLLTFTGNPGIGFVAGLITMAIFGFAGGAIFGGGDDE